MLIEHYLVGHRRDGPTLTLIPRPVLVLVPMLTLVPMLILAPVPILNV